jgi:type II secretory pathway pseudopilin PulG
MKILFFFTKEENLKKNGFSLVEVVFAIGIITVGIVAIMMLFSQNIKNEIRNKNKLIAIYLAEEQIEVIRQLRDNNWKIDLPGITWKSGIPTDNDVVVVNKDTDNDGDYDFTEGWEAEKVVGVGNQWKKEVFKGSNFYFNRRESNETFGKKTGFQRWLRIKNCDEDSDDCLEITSNVSHDDISDIQIKTRLYNWK